MKFLTKVMEISEKELPMISIHIIINLSNRLVFDS